MPHDLNGQSLSAGDKVMIPCVVKSVQAGEEYCNLTIESEHGRKPDGIRETITLNAAVVVKATMLLLLALTASAEEKDVPSSARREIAMRGNMVEHVDGQVSAGDEEDLIGQAAVTPPDDSHKWHLTILTQGGCRACERLLADLESDAFRDWVNVHDPSASHLHLHVLRYDGDLGRDYARKLEKFLGRRLAEFPTMIVQPPANGSFGQHTQIVYMGSGYDGDAEKLTAEMARTIGRYCERLKQIRLLVRREGHQADGEEKEASPPPFLLSPSNPPATPGTWNPTTLIPPRVAATVEQIKAVCQDCDAEFLLSQISKSATIEEAVAAWGVEQVRKQTQELKRAAEEAKAKALEEAKAAADKILADAKAQAEKLKPVVTPATGLSWESILALIGISGGLLSIPVLVGWGIRGILWIRNFRVSQGQTPTISDALAARLDKLDDVLIALGNKMNPAP